MNPKQLAAEAALTHIRSNTVVGLGTGSTAVYFIQALGDALAAKKLENIQGIPLTSNASEKLARELNIPLTTLSKDSPDITVDGADEIDPNLDLIKGLGGALVREKIVAQNSKRLIIIADDSKISAKLGTKPPLPVEVVQFENDCHVRFFKSIGAQPVLRLKPDGKPFITDNNNVIYDCRFPSGIDDAKQLEEKLLHRAGVVDTGLFLDIAWLALVATPTETKEMKRK